jgi:Uma2 family endonuclease
MSEITAGAIVASSNDVEYALSQEPRAGQHMTAEAFAQLPKYGHKYELIEGEVTMAPAGMYHDEIVINLGSALLAFVRQNMLGRVYASSVGYRIDESNVVSPDVSFVSASRLVDGSSPDSYGDLAPDLAVEIVFPNDRALEVEQKINLYLAHGTRLVWVIHPRQRTATIHRADGTGQRIGENELLRGEDVLPGFACKLSDIL